MSRCIFLTGILLVSFFVPAFAQSTSPAPASPAAPPSATSSPSPVAEISSEDHPTTFSVKVNLVQVRVVVRDGQGNAIGNLRKEDFQLFDNKKPQTISRFSLERDTPGLVVNQTLQASKKTGGDEETPALPERYIVYMFDDVHLQVGDLLPLRVAAVKHLAGLRPVDRAAIFTTSGVGNVDFTTDHQRIEEALLRLNPRPLAHVTSAHNCPPMTDYQADMIQNHHDQEALDIATNDALACAYNNDPQMRQAAQSLAQNTAVQYSNSAEHEVRVTFSTLTDAVRRLSIMPGQRLLVLLSPGFLDSNTTFEEGNVIERALKANVIISTLDARGLYTVDPTGQDISQAAEGNPDPTGAHFRWLNQGKMADSLVMANLAESTGGTFFHNNNDFVGGLKRLAAPPEYSYVLAFNPENLKSDGKYHSIKVALANGLKYNVQARHGYFAPKKEETAEKLAKQEIEDEVFSRDEVSSLPAELHTQFFKASPTQADIAVLVRLDLRRIHFRKVDGRNNNNLTIVSAVFDTDGNFVTGNEKVLQMKLKDETLQSPRARGVTLKSDFSVKPGTYLVRLVVRDDEGQISAQNGAVTIPQ